MYKSLLLAAATAILIGPAAAQPGHGKGGGPPGHDGGPGAGAKGQPGPGGPGGGPKGDRGPTGPGGGSGRGAAGPGDAPKLERSGRELSGGPLIVRGPGGPDGPDRGARVDRGPPGQAGRPDRGPDRGGPDRWAGRGPERTGPGREGPGRDRIDVGPEAGPRGPDREARWDARGAGPGPGRPADRGERVRFGDGGRWLARGEPLIAGCPPGLARKGNGCLPPGQARRIWGNPDPWNNWYGDWGGYARDPRWDYRYADGYLYRVDPTTSLISAFLPLLGGALFTGNAWPDSYTDYAVPAYYDDYYGWDDDLDYRYADGAIFGVEPGTNRIAGIAGLLTGNDWAVGSPMPVGYDLYNLPPQYRDRWADGPDRWYRYSDGYVYQVDPRTRLVQQIMSLVA